ncbi:PepSY domain-containing protein [Sedimenticola sp.]|uniref:PepSY domain-containing protein n=1 Tax=Sedimenticola sp. TaxID=1940285 RepID=UPI00258E688F|nr:PepSY domain-containing protein [Sedimenticola sp.]MCW8905580.1 PepSY domain-containing protein [Sedimenticola sp.]
MKTSHAILAIALTAATFGGTAFAVSATDSANMSNAATDNWLAIPAIYEKVTAAGFNDIYEIERERNGYKIKAVGRNGERVKLFVDPMTGEVLQSRSKQDKYRGERTGTQL